MIPCLLCTLVYIYLYSQVSMQTLRIRELMEGTSEDFQEWEDSMETWVHNLKHGEASKHLHKSATKELKTFTSPSNMSCLDGNTNVPKASQESQKKRRESHVKKKQFTSILSEEEMEKEMKEDHSTSKVFISPPSIVLPQTVSDNIKSILIANRPGILMSKLLSFYNQVHRDQQIELKQYGIERALLFVLSQPNIMTVYYSVADEDLKVVDTEYEMNRREQERKIMEKLEADKYGYYSLQFPRFMLVEKALQKDLERRLRRVSRISLSEKNVYVRFKKKTEAARCLQEFSSQIGMRMSYITPEFLAGKKSSSTSMSQEDDLTESPYASEANVDEAAIRVILGSIDFQLTKDEIERKIKVYNPISINVFIRRKHDTKEIRHIHANVKFAPWDMKKAEEMVKDLNHKKWKGTKSSMSCYIKNKDKEKTENGKKNDETVRTKETDSGKSGFSSDVMLTQEKQLDVDQAETTSSKKYWWKKGNNVNEDEEEIDYDATSLFC